MPSLPVKGLDKRGQSSWPTISAPSLTTLETEASRRTLPILELIVPALEHILDEQTESKRVFPSEAGTAILPRNLARQYKALLVQAKLPAEIRFHDLRHFAGSALLTEGLDIRTVMEVLGHTEVGTTLNVYAQSRPEKKRSAVESAVKAVFGAAKQRSKA